MLEANASVSIPQAVWIACDEADQGENSMWSRVSIPQAVWIACNFEPRQHQRQCLVSIPQAVWIACNEKNDGKKLRIQRFNTASGMDCMQFNCPIFFSFLCVCFNTASGMDCMQYEGQRFGNARSWVFQYRKRYGLHAIAIFLSNYGKIFGFNTASGMDCMQCVG